MALSGLSLTAQMLARLGLTVAVGCVSACHTPRGLALVPTTAQQIHIGRGELDLSGPMTFKRSDLLWFEGAVYAFAPTGACVPRIEVSFYGGSGLVKCGSDHTKIRDAHARGQELALGNGHNRRPAVRAAALAARVASSRR